MQTRERAQYTRYVFPVRKEKLCYCRLSHIDKSDSLFLRLTIFSLSVRLEPLMSFSIGSGL